MADLAPVVPRLHTPRNPELPTYGDIAARIAAACGRPFMDWQREAADVTLEYHPETGVLAHPTALWLVPRQAGKTTCLVSWMNTLALLRDRARVYFTMQTGVDASEWLTNEAQPLMEPLRRAGLTVNRNPSGRESTRWVHNDSLVRMFAPQRDALHSKQSDGVALDEVWAHTDIRGGELLQAIGPTQATRAGTKPGAQVLMMSAAGDATSTFLISQLREMRSAHARKDPGVVVIEYGVPEGEDATDPDVAARYHPAVGRTIPASYLHDERKRLGPEGFARAYGCHQVMPDLGSGSIISPEDWGACRDDAPLPNGTRLAGIGVDIAPDRSVSAIVVATTTGILETVRVEHGTAWVAPEAVRLARLWGADLFIDRGGPAATVADIVEEDYDRHLLADPALTARDVGIAAARFHDDVEARRLRHRTNPDLDLAVESAATRPLGEAWTWSRRAGGGPIVPLVAASLAWFAYTRHRRQP